MSEYEEAIAQGLSTRLREAIAHSPFDSIKQFQQALEEEAEKHGLRGASYSQFHRYLQKEQVPPLPLLRGIADLAGVRPEWLVFGDGEPTATEEAVRRGQVAADEVYGQPNPAVQEFIREYMVDLFGWASAIDQTAGSDLLMAVLGRLLASCPDSEDATPEQVARLALLIRTAALRPINVLTGDLDRLPASQLQDYLWSVTLAMRTAIPGRNEGASITELTDGVLLPEERPSDETDEEDETELVLLVRLVLERFDGNATWLAEEARVTPAAVRNWKAGRRTPSAESLDQIAHAVETEFGDKALAEVLRNAAERRTREL